MLQPVFLATLLAALAAPAQAQTRPEAPPAAAASAPAADMADGEIRKIDKDGQKLTIRHGEIRNLDMPPMTMVFQVREASLLERLKVGDKVRFAAQKAGSGFVVTTIQPAP